MATKTHDLGTMIGALAIKAVRRELKPELESMRSTLIAQRGINADLKRRIHQLEQDNRHLTSELKVLRAKQPATTDAAISMRFSPQRLVQLRERLGLTHEKLAKLLEVSVSTTMNLQREGATRPKEVIMERISELRQLGKRGVASRLSALEGRKGKAKA